MMFLKEQLQLVLKIGAENCDAISLGYLQLHKLGERRAKDTVRRQRFILNSDPAMKLTRATSQCPGIHQPAGKDQFFSLSCNNFQLANWVGL